MTLDESVSPHQLDMDIPTDLDAYDDYVERMRREEYPMLQNATYMDHAGTTLYSRSLMESFHQDMMSNLYGNPHSASPSSQKSTHEIESVRLELLQFLNADPEHFDLVFTANATAGIKLIGDAFREFENGFSYGYHMDSHTSLVGLRELSNDHQCLTSDQSVENWLNSKKDTRPRLFAYPAQSNMNGRRLPLAWSALHCSQPSPKIYTLLDAAAYASTSPLDLSDPDMSPDFTALSLYKIFGFPDLGALIIKKNAGHVFRHRRYFGGGTVDMVVCLKEQWHASKSGSLHEQLEDGTLPIHSILAIKSALKTHATLYGTLERISGHTAHLAKQLYEGLVTLQHSNGMSVCKVYKYSNSTYGNTETQGPVVAFNLCDSKGNWISTTEVEKVASVQEIHLRTGGVCNPGGVAMALNLEAWEMRENFSAGHRCGGENDILNGKPTGVIRLSLGAMSTRSDIERAISFIDEFFVDRTACLVEPSCPVIESTERTLHVESLTVYPIKSCGGWQIPYGQVWEVRPEGLAWDREWCLMHQGTGRALSQKQFPRMALLRPVLDFVGGVLCVSMAGSGDEISVPMSRNPNLYASSVRDGNASVCEDPIQAFIYLSPTIADFFTKAIGVACTLARFNPASNATRHFKPHLQSSRHHTIPTKPRPILLSNESPILTISRSSLNRLNEQIKEKGGKAAHATVFRANVILAESPLLPPGQEKPWAEDDWQGMRIGGVNGVNLDFLGGCRRCQMVCVDQESAEKNAEPFVTLAKTRRYNGRVLFGIHTALREPMGRCASIKAGDDVTTFVHEDQIAL